VPDADNLDITQSLSIMAWAKTEKNKTAKVVQKGDWDGYNIALDKWEGWKCSIRMANNTTHGLKWGEGRPLLKEWYHIALTYYGSQMRLYVNGKEKSSKAVAGELKVNSRPVSFGSDNGAQKFFKGTIDDVRIYNQALTEEEIQAIYNGQQSTDSDGDGVPNDEDAYPYDTERAFNNFYPSGDYASLAFEDLWPGLGDYDFNDLVLDYTIEKVEITYGYLKFYEWAGSGCTSYPDWYKDESGYRDDSKIYPVP